MSEQLTIRIVPHTHWDREWYQTFQQFRIRLVHTIDKLLDILDHDPHFKHFMLDGQTIVLDDYLEVRPEQEEHLRKYIHEGRIQAGPWYLQPDEFLVSGESLIRNLQIGIRRASEFGEPMLIGYLPDCFGHIAQLPQILQGFGIDTAVLWRGVGEEAPESEFHWSAPDGTHVLVIHLSSPTGYSNARVLPLKTRDFVTRVELLISQILAKAGTSNLLFMNGSDHLEPQDGLPLAIEAANHVFAKLDPEHDKNLARFIQNGHNGNGKSYDSLQVQIGTLSQHIEAVRQQKSQFATLSGELRSSQYAHLLPSVLSSRMWIKQQNTASEHLLEHWVEPLSAWAWKLGRTYPTGLIKLAWKYLLQNHPHDSICGCSIDQVHRENSVRFAQSQQVSESLISRAMHDIVASLGLQPPTSTPHTHHRPVPIVVFNPAPGPRTEVTSATVQIPGSLNKAVIIDEHGSSMPFRWQNTETRDEGSMIFAREVVATAVAMSESTEPGQFIRTAHEMIASFQEKDPNSFVMSKINIMTGREEGIAHIEILIEPVQEEVGNQQELLAAEAQILNLLEREDIHSLEVSLVNQAHETIEFVAKDIPAFGLKTFWLYPRGLSEEKSEPVEANGQGTPNGNDTSDNGRDKSANGRDKSVPTEIGAVPTEIENEWYRVAVSPEDGSLSITDKQTGAVFSGLNRFVDGGDVGDLYNYCPPAQDTLILRPGDVPTIEFIDNGPVRQTLRVRGNWLLPASCSADRSERSPLVTSCPIVSEISLVPGVRRVDIHTTIENSAKDHRTRVLFPVPYVVQEVSAEGTFEVRTRPVALPQAVDVADWIEKPVNTFPQKRFVDISNGNIGLGIINCGLPEYEVLEHGPGIAEGQMAVALTLLRCVEWLSRGDLSTRRGHAGPMEWTPEAQCQGRNEFDYALVPHSGPWNAENGLVVREAQAFNIGVRAIVKTEQAQETGQLYMQEASLLQVEPPELVVSAIKQSNNGKGLVVRVYNPLDRAIEASLYPGVACKSALVANLQEEPVDSSRADTLFWSGEDAEPLHIGLRAGEIITIVFE